MRASQFRLFAVIVGAVALSLAATASAAIERNERFEYDAGTFTCSGEVIDVHVVVHLLSRVQEDAAGGVHLGSTVTTMLTGTSADGTRYVGPSHQTTQIRMSPSGGATTHTETFHENLIRIGDGPGDTGDLRTRAVFHFTIDANGRLTVSLFEFTADCA